MAKREELTFDELDVQIIAGLSLGMTQQATAKWVCTPDYPTGVTDRTVRNRLADKQIAFERLILHIARAFSRKEEEFEALTKEKYRERLERLRSKSVRVKELALDNALQSPNAVDSLALGVKVAESIEDRDFGKAKQVVEHDGDVNHNYILWTGVTPRQLEAHQVDMDDSEDLLKALPGDVMDAEVVADA